MIDGIGSEVYGTDIFSEETLNDFDAIGVQWRGRNVLDIRDDARIKAILLTVSSYTQNDQINPEDLPKLKAEILDLFVEEADDDESIEEQSPFYQYDPVSGAYEKLIVAEKHTLKKIGKAFKEGAKTVEKAAKKAAKAAEKAARKAAKKAAKVARQVVHEVKKGTGKAIEAAEKLAEYGGGTVAGPSTSLGPNQNSPHPQHPGHHSPPQSNPLAQNKSDFNQNLVVTPQNLPPIALPHGGIPPNQFQPNPYQQSPYPHHSPDLRPNNIEHFPTLHLPTNPIPHHFASPAVNPEATVHEVAGTTVKSLDIDLSKVDEKKTEEEEEDLASLPAQGSLLEHGVHGTPAGSTLVEKIISLAAGDGSIALKQAHQNTTPQDPSLTQKIAEKTNEALSGLVHEAWKATGILGKNTLQLIEELNPTIGLKKGKSLKEGWEAEAVPFIHEKIDQGFSTNIKDEFDPKKDGKFDRVAQDFFYNPLTAIGGGLAEETVVEGQGLKAAANEVVSTVRTFLSAEKAGALEPAVIQVGNAFAKESAVTHEATLAGRQAKSIEHETGINNTAQKLGAKNDPIAPNLAEMKNDVLITPKTSGNLQKQVEQGRAPKSVNRVDKGRGEFEKDHIHFKDGSALNSDGTWKHGGRQLTRQEADWLQENGWSLPKDN